MSFTHSHLRFIAKSRVKGHTIEFDHGLLYMPYDAASVRSPYHLDIRAIFRTKECVEVNTKWWSLKDHGAIRFGRVAKLEFHGKAFSAHLKDLRSRLEKCGKRSTEAGNLAAELAVEQALYYAFVEGGDIEVKVAIGKDKECPTTSVFLHLRYGESPLVAAPEVIEDKHWYAQAEVEVAQDPSEGPRPH